MSHISRIKTQIVNKDYLLQALKDLGYEAEEGAFTIGSLGGEKIDAQIRLKLRLSSPIAFRLHDGVYEVVADWWGVRKLKKQEFISQLTQRYAYQAARARLEAQGFSLVNEETAKNGEIRLVLRRTV